MRDIVPTDLTRYAGWDIPVLRFPDGTRIELTSDMIHNHPARTCVELRRWLDQWSTYRQTSLEEILTK